MSRLLPWLLVVALLLVFELSLHRGVPALAGAQGANYTAGTVLTSGGALPGTCTVGALFMLTAAPIGLHQCLVTNTWSAAAAASEWTTSITKLVDETVTADTNLQDDDELFFAVGADETWYIQMLLVYSGNAVGTEFKFTATHPAGRGVYQTTYNNTADGIQSSGTRVSDGSNSLSTFAAGTRALITTYEQLQMYIVLSFNSGGTFQVQHANNASGVTTLKAGSVLRGKKLR